MKKRLHWLLMLGLSISGNMITNDILASKYWQFANIRPFYDGLRIQFHQENYMILQISLFLKTSLGLSRLSKRNCLLVLALVIESFVVYADPVATNNTEIEKGRRIYLEGVLSSGTPLQGQRGETEHLEGMAAACETCHRRSGMGSLEGNIVVPPISGRFLFATEENRPIALVDYRAAKNLTRAHAAYTDASLARAIREGINVSDSPLSPLMPRYDLDDADIKAVTAYLKTLSSDLPAGVGEDSLRFATIVTPGVDVKKKDVMIAMMRTAFSQRNNTQQTYSGRMRMPIDLIPRTLRNWQLSVWELQGKPETWGAQLAEKYRQEPVFAVISGVSNTTWAPVHAFCEQEKLPCVMPSIALPPAAADFYSMYYSRGVVLEADVLAKYLRDQGKKTPVRLLQVYQEDEVGLGASQSLIAALRDSGIKVENYVLNSQTGSKLSKQLKSLSKNDAVMFWLQPEELTKAFKAAPKKLAVPAFMSGSLAEENYSVVSKSLKSSMQVVYPYELGEKRKKNLSVLKDWLKSWSLPLVDEAFQSEVFFDLLFLTDMTSQMLDNLYPDYMLERAEDMLSVGSNVSVYPHLSMSRGQRFASKGAYIAGFSKDGSLKANSGWIVPW